MVDLFCLSFFNSGWSVPKGLSAALDWFEGFDNLMVHRVLKGSARNTIKGYSTFQIVAAFRGGSGTDSESILYSGSGLSMKESFSG